MTNFIERTFMFTDIKGSTNLWERYPDEMRAALSVHDEILETIINQHGGTVFKTVGDAFCAVFDSPDQAVECAIEAQSKLASEGSITETVSIEIRVGIHLGEAESRDGDYFGPTLNQVARIEAAAIAGTRSSPLTTGSEA